MIEVPESGKFTVKELIELGLNRKQSDFKFISSFAEFKNVWSYLWMTRRILRCLKRVYRDCTKEYHKQFKLGNPEVDLVITLAQVLTSIDFYKTELIQADDILDEYITYLLKGNLWKVLLGRPREESDLVDFRNYFL